MQLIYNKVVLKVSFLIFVREAKFHNRLNETIDKVNGLN